MSLAYVTRPEEDTCPPVDPQPAGGTVCVGRQPAAEALGDQSPLHPDWRLGLGTSLVVKEPELVCEFQRS